MDSLGLAAELPTGAARLPLKYLRSVWASYGFRYYSYGQASKIRPGLYTVQPVAVGNGKGSIPRSAANSLIPRNARWRSGSKHLNGRIGELGVESGEFSTASRGA